MSYETIDNSTESGKPLFLLEFARGANITRFNSGATNIVSGAFTYQASHFDLSARTQGKDIFKDALKITFARVDNFARSYILSIHEQVTTVTLKRMHVGMSAADAVTEWKGRLVTATTNGDKITLDCESIYTSMRRLGLSTQFELTCVHAIYSAGCKANKPAMRVNASISAVSKLTYTIPAASGYPVGHFNAGMMEYAGERRFITSHTGQTIILSRSMGVIAGTTVALYPGCDKLLSTCVNKFNNNLNYLGFPWMPNDNPFGGLPIARV